MVAATAISLLLHLSNATTLSRALIVGLVAGAGLSAAVTAVNAISPNVPRPALYAAVVGSYHFAGSVLAAAIVHWLSK